MQNRVSGKAFQCLCRLIILFTCLSSGKVLSRVQSQQHVVRCRLRSTVLFLTLKHHHHLPPPPPPACTEDNISPANTGIQVFPAQSMYPSGIDMYAGVWGRRGVVCIHVCSPVNTGIRFSCSVCVPFWCCRLGWGLGGVGLGVG